MASTSSTLLPLRSASAWTPFGAARSISSSSIGTSSAHADASAAWTPIWAATVIVSPPDCHGSGSQAEMSPRIVATTRSTGTTSITAFTTSAVSASIAPASSAESTASQHALAHGGLDVLPRHAGLLGQGAERVGRARRRPRRRPRAPSARRRRGRRRRARCAPSRGPCPAGCRPTRPGRTAARRPSPSPRAGRSAGRRPRRAGTRPATRAARRPTRPRPRPPARPPAAPGSTSSDCCLPREEHVRALRVDQRQRERLAAGAEPGRRCDRAPRARCAARRPPPPCRRSAPPGASRAEQGSAVAVGS